MKMFMKLFLIIVKNWRQPKYPSIIEWEKTTVYSYNEIVYCGKNKSTIGTVNNMNESQK